MSAPKNTTALSQIVKKRARELRLDGVGYSDAVSALADELYLSERGKETRLSELGATPGLVAPLLGGDVTSSSLFAKGKKAKARALGTLKTLISHWVSDAYEES